MITFTCDACGTSYPVTDEQPERTMYSGFWYNKTIGLYKPNQLCFECQAKVDEAEEEAKEQARKATIASIGKSKR